MGSQEETIPKRTGDSKKIRLFELICDKAAERFKFQDYPFFAFLDGDNQRLFIMKRYDSGFKAIKIHSELGTVSDYFKVSTAKLGFSFEAPKRVVKTTPTGTFLLSLKPEEGGRKKRGKGVGNTEAAQTMWSFFLALIGQEDGNKKTPSSELGFHGSLLFSSVIDQKPKSHGCIRLLCEMPENKKPKSKIYLEQYKTQPRIEDILQFLHADRLPVFIYVSNPFSMHLSFANRRSFHPPISQKLVEQAKKELGLGSSLGPSPSVPVQPKPVVKKPVVKKPVVKKPVVKKPVVQKPETIP